MTPAEPAAKLRARRAAQALALWQGIVLVGILAVTLSAIWHLRRRSRAIRASVRPQRVPPDTFDDRPEFDFATAPDAPREPES